MSNSNNAATKQVKDNLKETKNDVLSNTENIIDEAEQKVLAKSDQVADTTKDYKGKVSENLSGAADKAQEKFNTAQGFLSDKADIVNEYAHYTIERANQIGHKAADVLVSSSDYVKNFDFTETRQQIKTKIKDQPELSIVAAGIFGLLIGLIIGRKK